jgi:hypothetical protein
MNTETREDQTEALDVKAAIAAVEDANTARETAHYEWVQANEGSIAAQEAAKMSRMISGSVFARILRLDWFARAAKGRWDAAAEKHQKAKTNLCIARAVQARMKAAEALEPNPIIDDVPVVETNVGGHRVTIRTGLPKLVQRYINEDGRDSHKTPDEIRNEEAYQRLTNSSKTPEQIAAEDAYGAWVHARNDFQAKTEELGRARAAAKLANASALKSELEAQNLSEAT